LTEGQTNSSPASCSRAGAAHCGARWVALSLTARRRGAPRAPCAAELFYFLIFAVPQVPSTCCGLWVSEPDCGQIAALPPAPARGPRTAAPVGLRCLSRLAGAVHLALPARPSCFIFSSLPCPKYLLWAVGIRTRLRLPGNRDQAHFCSDSGWHLDKYMDHQLCFLPPAPAPTSSGHCDVCVVRTAIDTVPSLQVRKPGCLGAG
jgi:hypothetical protein